jgi:DNA-binding MarR family transcriptional regulator
MTTGEAADVTVAAGLLRLSFLVQGVFARASDRHELTPAQAKLLCILADRPRGMAELAVLLGVEKAAVTGLVDRVERRGLAERSPVPDDRRALRVAVTGPGRRAAAAFHHEVSAELDGIVAGLPAAERERFRGTLARIIEACGAPPVPAAAWPWSRTAADPGRGVTGPA